MSPACSITEGATAIIGSVSYVPYVCVVLWLSGRSSVVYRLGSKLAHTCGSANTTYRSYAGKGPLFGYHIAVKAIEAGDLLTTCYLGERHLLLPTRTRCAAAGLH